MTDLVRNMWAYSETSAPVSSLTDSLIGLAGAGFLKAGRPPIGAFKFQIPPSVAGRVLIGKGDRRDSDPVIFFVRLAIKDPNCRR